MFYLKHYLKETPVINWKMLKKRAARKWNEKLLLSLKVSKVLSYWWQNYHKSRKQNKEKSILLQFNASFKLSEINYIIL